MQNFAHTLCLALQMFICCTALASPTPLTLQAGAFQDYQHAENLQTRLAYLTPQHAKIHTDTARKPPLHIVSLGRFKNRPDATRLQQHLAVVGINTRIKQLRLERIRAEQEAQRKQTSTVTTPADKSPAVISIKPDANKRRLWNLRNADIRTVIEAISHETGKNFLIDPRVQGRISIVSASPLSSAEVYQVFLSMLQISGYAAVPEGRIVKIIPNLDSNAYAARVASNMRSAAHGDELIVRVVPIKYVSAQQLVPNLRPLMPQWGHISAYIPSNSLILSGRANNINRLLDIIRRVDTASQNDIDVVYLRNAVAEDIAATLKELRKANSISDNQNVAISPDARTNSILISGPRAQRLRLRVLVSELDTPSESGINGTTQVVYLKFLKARDLVPILAGVAKARFKGSVGVTIGTRTLDTATQIDKRDNEDHLHSPANSTTANNPAEVKTSQTNQEKKGPQVEIVAEPNTNAVIINAPPALMRTLRSVIAKLDIRPAQILVEAMIAEIDENDVNTLGIDWGSRGNFLDSATNSFANGFGIIDRTGFSTFEAQIRALATLTKANILSTPSVVVLDNHLAHIKVGQEVSIITANYPNNANATTTASPYNVFDRKDVALVLNVTPQITHNNGVRLTIAHQNDTLQDPSQISTTPVFNISEIRTSVLVESGDVLVLGGLIRQQLSEVDRRLPIVGKIPGLGRIFHRTTKTNEKKKLLVFLRTRILKNRFDSLHVSGAKYDDSREQQLAELRKRPYSKDEQATVLNDLQNKAILPQPFYGPYPPRSRFPYRQGV